RKRGEAGRRGSSRRGALRLDAGQKQGQAGALARFAVDADFAARLGGEAVYLAKAKAGALACALGGEEWLKYSVGGFGVHARTGIGEGDGHHHRTVIAALDSGANGEAAAVEHGVACVGRDVEQCRLELGSVDFDAAAVRVQVGCDVDAFTDGALNKLGHFDDQRIDVDLLGLERLTASEGKELAGEAG